MRLPLGILTGVGFIGGGAILRRGGLVTRVTTAATLWVTTVIGLCLGGGQLAVGMAATLLVIITLWAFQWLDIRIPREHRAILVINTNRSSSSTSDLANLIGPAGYRARFHRQGRGDDAEHVRLWFEISWRRAEVAGHQISTAYEETQYPAMHDYRFAVLMALAPIPALAGA